MKYNFDLDLQTRNSLSCIIERINPNTKVLEFGCANGRLTKYLSQKMNCTVDIIELDETSGAEAATYARRALLGSEDGNAETFLWRELLDNEEYDYIVFADILEHLRNPKDVLHVAKQCLKQNGSILVSVPNIANNNVIANLLRNEFVYTDIGLLDNTHVTFFTKNSFEKLVKEAGYYLAYETATYINMGNCEVPITFQDIASDVKKVLMKHPLGDAYQFIFELKTYPVNTVCELEEFPEKYFLSTLYYKYCDADLDGNNNIQFNSKLGDNTFSTALTLDKEVDLFRLDFMENSGVILIKSIKVNDIEVSNSNLIHNALVEKDNVFVFSNTDPFFYLEVKPIKKFKIEVSYEILNFNLEEGGLVELIDMIEIKKAELSNVCEQKETLNKNIQVLEKEKIQLIDENLGLQNENNSLNAENVNLKDKIVNNEENIKILNEEVHKLNDENREVTMLFEQYKTRYLQDEERLDRIHHRTKWLWKLIDHDSYSLQGNKIHYHIDSVTMSLRHVHIRGWCISEEQLQCNIKGRRTLHIVKYSRPDVNKVKGLDDNYVSGFDIFALPFLPLSLHFQVGKNSNTYKLNTVKIYSTYWHQLIGKLKQSLCDRGLKKTIKLCLYKLTKKGNPFTDSYEEWFFRHRVSKKELEEQKRHTFSYQPKISVLVPTYNTPDNLLNEMVQSIKNQSYSNWELCIADGNSQKRETIALLEKLSNEDKRIKVNFLKENYMISGNTNEAVKMATGEYIALMDHDDLLELDALYEFVKLLNKQPELDFIYSDEDKINEDGTHYMIPHFKPDFSMDTLRSYNYITHFAMIRKSVLDEVGLFDSKCDGAQDFDLFLRICDYTKNIGHVQKILYHWRVCENSTAQSISTKSYVVDAGKYSLRKHLARNGLEGEVTDGLEPTLYKINFDIVNNPLISIIICTKDHIDDLDNCIQSIIKKSTYNNYEIIIVENNSESKETFAYYEQIKNHDKIRVIYWKDDFNYSGINNFGVQEAKGEYVLLLNNDTEVITPNWLEEMLMYAQRDDVGVVGSKLLYPDDTVQHAGVIVGLGGVAAHSHRGFPASSVGYVGRMIVVQNISAVTGACMMIKKSKYLEVGGLSEKYKVTYNDVDFCLKVMKAGYHNIMTPFAQMYHYESKSRGMEDTPEKHKRFMAEQDLFKSDWKEILENGDPYYNKNLTLDREDFSLRE